MIVIRFIRVGDYFITQGVKNIYILLKHHKIALQDYCWIVLSACNHQRENDTKLIFTAHIKPAYNLDWKKLAISIELL